MYECPVLIHQLRFVTVDRLGLMEVSYLKVLLSNISVSICLSSYGSRDSNPVQKYYKQIEEILKLLKPILYLIADSKVASDEIFKKDSEELGQVIYELRELFEIWHPLMSKIYFILKIESLIHKCRTLSLEILLLLKLYHECLPTEFNSASLEPCIEKLEVVGCEQTTNNLDKAIRHQAEGVEISLDGLDEIANSVNLKSNQELLIEDVALEKLKENAEHAEDTVEVEYIDKMIAFVNHMQHLTAIKLSQNRSHIPIPADFCCPLSLELMRDPVIAASGQTYERVFIINWIDLGLSVCPKTRQTLSDTNLIPNYNVKALIAAWCESNGVMLPDPMRAMTLNLSMPLLGSVESGPPRDQHFLNPRVNLTCSTESTQRVGLTGKNLISHSGTHQVETNPSHPRSSEGCLSAVVGNCHLLDIGRLSLESSEYEVTNMAGGTRAGKEPPVSTSRNEFCVSGADLDSCKNNKRTSSASSTLSSLGHHKVLGGDGKEVPQIFASSAGCCSVASGEMTLVPSVSTSRNEFYVSREDAHSYKNLKRSFSASSTLSSVSHLKVSPKDGKEVPQISASPTANCSDAFQEMPLEPKTISATLNTPHRELEFPQRLDTISQSCTFRNQLSEKSVPRIISSSAAIKPQTNPSGIETQVQKLAEDLTSVSIDTQRKATEKLRLLARNYTDNRIVIANSGAINLLINLLHSTDSETQENAVTALLNLSINDNNKMLIANAEAIKPLVHVLETGTPEAKENSAATLFSLSVNVDNKIKIGRSGAIEPLVDLLGNGTPRGKKDAVTALFNLSLYHENKDRIVKAGAVRYLVELMDPAAGMVDKAVAVLSNLATIDEGRIEIGREGGIPVLVDVVELGSARGKENAAAALYQLCTSSGKICNMVLQEGAVPPLVALSHSGTARAREKAQLLLNCFRRGNGGRG